MSRSLKLGLSAALSQGYSVHTRTFHNAIKAIRQLICPMSEYAIEIIYADDFATQRGGCSAAKQLLKKNVDVVIGHFSSLAAMGACEVYYGRDVTVLLPAASAPILASGEKRVFRLCPDDNKQAHSILNFIKQENFSFVAVDSDGSASSEYIVHILMRELERSAKVSSSLGGADLYVFVGRAEPAVHKIVNSNVSCSILLTDDANTPLVKNVVRNLDNACYVTSFEYSELRNFPSQGKLSAPTYYSETIAAAQLCLGAADITNLEERTLTPAWRTCIGDVKFVDGENQNARVGIRKLRQNKR